RTFGGSRPRRPGVHEPARRVDRAWPSVRRDGRALRHDARQRDGAAVFRAWPGFCVCCWRSWCCCRARTGMTTVSFEPAGEDGIARIVIDRPDDRVNAINPQVVEDLAAAVRCARSVSPRGVILTSAKADQWIAGADLNMVTGAS